MYEFATELVENRRVGGERYASAIELLGESGTVELVGTLGYYTLDMTLIFMPLGLWSRPLRSPPQGDAGPGDGAQPRRAPPGTRRPRRPDRRAPSFRQSFAPNGARRAVLPARARVADAWHLRAQTAARARAAARWRSCTRRRRKSARWCSRSFHSTSERCSSARPIIERHDRALALDREPADNGSTSRTSSCFASAGRRRRMRAFGPRATADGHDSIPRCACTSGGPWNGRGTGRAILTRRPRPATALVDRAGRFLRVSACDVIMPSCFPSRGPPSADHCSWLWGSSVGVWLLTWTCGCRPRSDDDP